MVQRPLWPCAVLLVTGALCLLLGGLALYGRHAVLDQRQFGARAQGTLAQDEVLDEISGRIVQRTIDAHPELATRRPVLDAAAADLVAVPAFPQAFRTGAERMHHTLFANADAPPQLVLPGLGPALWDAVNERSPALAATLPDSDPELLALGGGRLETGLRDAAPWARRLSALAPFALLAGLGLLAAAVLRAPTRRRGLRRAAVAVATVGGTAVAATAIGKALVLATFDTGHGDAVVGTIWNAYLEDLRLWGLAVGALGLVLAAAAEPGARGSWRRLLAGHPAGRGGRLARAGALVVLAALLVVAPEVPLDLALVCAAGFLVFSGASEVVRLRQAALPAD